MFCSMESVTVGVGNVESGLQFFRDRLGLRVVNDTRASVGLVAAWRRPVHESVRLVDLASAASIVSPSTGGKKKKVVPASSKSLPPGRVRLAVYEDVRLSPASRDALGDKTIPSTSGPWGLEFTGSADGPVSSSLVQGPDGLLVLAPASFGEQGPSPSQATRNPPAVGSVSTSATRSAPSSASATGKHAALAAARSASLSALWISTSHFAASTRFYTEALGLQSVNDPTLAAHLTNTKVSECVAFSSKEFPQFKLVLASFDTPTLEQQIATSMAVGQLGFNLISMRCDDLDELQKRIEALGIEPVTEPAHVGMPFGYPGRVMIVAGPNGELFEFDEITV